MSTALTAPLFFGAGIYIGGGALLLIIIILLIIFVF